MDFHGTISERRWEDKIIFPYVKKAIHNYLKENWTEDSVQRCLASLRNESFEQRFRHKYDEAPVINEEVHDEESDPSQLAAQVGDFLLWQMTNRKETRETHVIERLVWLDGYKRKKISTPVFDDVIERVKVWHEKYKCSIFVISSIDSQTMELILENTNKGNLARYLSGYISSSKAGEKIMSDLYNRFYEKHVKAKGILKGNERDCRKQQQQQQQQQSLDANIGHNNKIVDRAQSSLSLSASSSNKSISLSSARPILFLTDSGQEAKAASMVCDGSVYECLLVNRPGNKRIRIFYLTHFPYIETFNDIEFVH